MYDRAWDVRKGLERMRDDVMVSSECERRYKGRVGEARCRMGEESNMVWGADASGKVVYSEKI